MVKEAGESTRLWRLAFYGSLSLYAAAFLLYSETWAFGWDETYHLLAAQLILAGRKPYIDFCFPQTPLNAYWNAGWMSVFGQSWRVPQTIAAILAIGAVILMADFVATRFPVPSWRGPGALLAALLTGLNAMVFFYAPLGQPYGICLFTVALGFRFALIAVARPGPLLTGLAGLFAGVAAGSSLLSAAAVPIFLVWILVYNRAGRRWPKFLVFAFAVAIPFLPALWLFLQGPQQAWFNLVQYHLFFRKLYWPDTTSHDLEVLTSWINSGQALVLGLLALFGLFYVARRSTWPRHTKAEFYLCAWLAVALAAEVGRAHPTFPQYFLLIVPYVAILATAGLYAASSLLSEPGRALLPVSLIVAIMIFGLARSMYDRREEPKWSEYAALAAKIDQVAPPSAPLFANEPIYFLTRRIPPSGYELYYTHKIDLPAPERARLHILNESEVNRQVQSGRFPTAVSCDDDEITNYNLYALYSHNAGVADCVVFWGLKSRIPSR